MPDPNKPRKPNKVLLDIGAVCKVLSVSENTVRKIVRAGQLRKPRMVGGSPRWFWIDIKVYLARLRSGEFDEKRSSEDELKTDQDSSQERKNAQRPAKPPT